MEGILRAKHRTTGREAYGVYLGRFAPFHRGHMLVADAMLERHGPQHSIIMVGSSNSRNIRTPYTFEQREAMAKELFPGANVVPVPDVKPELTHFDGTSNKIWLRQLMKFEDDFGADFVFYGGSEKDLEILNLIFDTFVLVNRETEGKGYSATKVRVALEENNTDELNELLDPRIVPLAIAGFAEFQGL